MYKSLVFGDEFLAQGLHLTYTQTLTIYNIINVFTVTLINSMLNKSINFFFFLNVLILKVLNVCVYLIEKNVNI